MATSKEDPSKIKIPKALTRPISPSNSKEGNNVRSNRDRPEQINKAVNSKAAINNARNKGVVTALILTVTGKEITGTIKGIRKNNNSFLYKAGAKLPLLFYRRGDNTFFTKLRINQFSGFLILRPFCQINIHFQISFPLLSALSFQPLALLQRLSFHRFRLVFLRYRLQ